MFAWSKKLSSILTVTSWSCAQAEGANTKSPKRESAASRVSIRFTRFLLTPILFSLGWKVPANLLTTYADIYVGGRVTVCRGVSVAAVYKPNEGTSGR